MKTVVLLFHPNFEASRINKAFEQAISGDYTVRHMYDLYPDFKIDVAKEQAVLTEADRIVLQFPMYWYSSPSLLKEWQDQVLLYGWAYGSTGKALQGKELLLAVSTGAPNYTHEAGMYTATELLRPFQAMAEFCGMTYLTPFVVKGTLTMSDEDLAKHAKEYAEYLKQDSIPALGKFD
ncbi:MAG: NAD(P)H-dependent oxidoreductase [Veillonella sp.]|uniref:NAD(P)H-dependent oxidoreductase n=1 Tax=Veillonella sp. TaxID=1926307 RepID=UPI0025D28B11|nr:NAD(P)H-dependent oxidoreductase [Veillonella sp.]MBE6079324.1 NAD(P)H-dependent oxidoreductase [Veillonella sp.]